MSAGAETPRRSASNKVRPGAHAQERLAERTHDSARNVVRDLVAPVANNAGTGRQLPIALIDSSPLNPRKHFDGDELQRLADSLAADGLLQPIVVKPAGERFLIIAGERRWRAAKQLGWTDIDAIVRVDVDDATHLRLALLENLERADLDPLEEAEGYRQLQELGMTQKAIAEAVHRSQPSIANAIRLLKRPPKVQGLIREHKLTPSHGVALLRYESVTQVVEAIAEAAAEQRWPAHELEDKHGLLHRWEISRRVERIRGLQMVPIQEKTEWGPHTFVKEMCRKACPFDQYRKLPDGEFCLRPQHYQELAAAVKEAAQKAAAKERDRIKASAVKMVDAPVPEVPSATPPKGKLAVGQRVEFSPDCGYGSQGARGAIVEQRGDWFTVKLDNGKTDEVFKSVLVPLPPEEEQRRAVAADAGLPKLADLPSSVVRLDMALAPYPCQDRTCSCLGRALDSNGRPVFVCTKGRRHQQLLDDYESKRKSQNGLRRLEADRVLTAAAEKLETVGTRELALMAYVLTRASRPSYHGDSALLTDDALVSAANRSIKGAVQTNWRGPEIQFDKLADVEPLALARFGMEAVLRTSVERYYESGGDQLAKWYFGTEIPDFLAAGWRPPRDGVIADARSEAPAAPTVADGDELDEFDEEIEGELADLVGVGAES